MSLDPTAIPDAAPAATPEAGGELAEIWRNIWPWDDLNAKGPPERWLKLGPDVLPVLAALVASGGATPRLLSTDSMGSLLTVPNPILYDTVTTTRFIAPNTFIVPGNIRLYLPGTYFLIYDPTAPGPLSPPALYQVTSVQVDAFTYRSTVGTVPSAGSTILIVSPPSALVKEPPPYRSGLSYLFAHPAPGVQATVTINVTLTHPTARIVAVKFDMAAGAATNAIIDGEIRDGSGTVYYSHLLAVEGVVGSIDHVSDDELWLDVSPAIAPNTVLVQFSVGPPAGVSQRVSVAYTLP